MIWLRKTLIVIAFLFWIAPAFGKNPNDQILGSYYFGDGLGLNCYLALSKTGHFKYEWDGCLGTYDKAEGTFMIHEKTLSLTPNGPVESACRINQKVFHIVRWDKLIYLIPEADMLEFCNHINQRTEPVLSYWGSFYLNENHKKKKPKGVPDLPGNWNNFLLKAPVTGKILDVTGDNAILDSGTNKGVLPGMEFSAMSSDEKAWAQLTIISVSPDRSVAKVENNLDEKIKKGDCYSSLFELKCRKR
jgi:hypothetical protein